MKADVVVSAIVLGARRLSDASEYKLYDQRNELGLLILVVSILLL